MKEQRPPKIGDSVHRIAGLPKVTGKQIYPSDLDLEGMLNLRIFRSPHPHARILSLDTSRAEIAPGVVCVLTADDIPGELMTGLFRSDMPVLCADIIRRQGDPIAIVAAESDLHARQACELILAEYDLLPVVDDARDALKFTSPKVHPEGNLVSEIHLEQGDVENAFQKADQIFEFEYHTGRQEHAFLEPEGGAAYYDEGGRLTIRFGGQHPHWDREIIAPILRIDPEELRVISPMVGGSFGGKDDIDVQVYLALVTHLTKRPCRIRFSREESLVAGNKRHPFTSIYKTACDKHGKIIAAQVTLYADTGAYAGFGHKVLSTAVGECLGPYQIPNTKIDAYCVYTNNSNASAFRGFGAPQVAFPLESQVDIMALSYEIDPVDFRRKNLVKPGENTALGIPYQGNWSIQETLAVAENSPIYQNKHELTQCPDPEKKRGVGFAAALMGIGYGAGVPDRAEIHINLTQEGLYQMYIGGTDMGQGNATALMQIAAFELNCPMEEFELILGDSLGPDAGSCDAARQMTFVGRAAFAAAVDLRQKILDEAANELDSPLDDLVLEGKFVLNRKSGGKRSLAGLGTLLGVGLADIPDKEALLPGIPPHLYTTGAQIALVEVDLLTGKVDVLKMHSVIDAGKVINQQGIEGQTEGGIIQGLGYALYEDTVVTDGLIQNRGFSTYILPTAVDVPVELVSEFLEVPSKLGPYGAKGIAEIVLVPTAPAIINAVADAIGERFTKIPLSSEDVIMRKFVGK